MAMSMEQLFVLELMSAPVCMRHPVVDLPNRSICKEQVAVRTLSLLPFEQNGFCSRDPWKFAQALTLIAPVTIKGAEMRLHFDMGKSRCFHMQWQCDCLTVVVRGEAPVFAADKAPIRRLRQRFGW